MGHPRAFLSLSLLGWALAAYAAGDKKTSEPCADDDDCHRGHCYTKKSRDKVCVDCSKADISRFRAQPRGGRRLQVISQVCAYLRAPRRQPADDEGSFSG